MLVDDEPSIIRMLKQVIDWEQYNFTVCAESNDGEDAIEKIKTFSPDLVITDIRMPVVNGLDLIKYCVENLNVKTKFIIVSGYDDFQYVRSAFKYGVKDYLLKPLDPEELIEIIINISTDLNQQTNASNNTISNNISGEDTNIMIKIKDYINLNYKNQISLKSIAE